MLLTIKEIHDIPREMMTSHRKSNNPNGSGTNTGRLPIAGKCGKHLNKTVLLFAWLVIHVNSVFSDPINIDRAYIHRAHEVVVDDDISNDKIFTSTWAVHIPNGRHVAKRVAKEHGFTILGEVNSIFHSKFINKFQKTSQEAPIYSD